MKINKLLQVSRGLIKIIKTKVKIKLSDDQQKKVKKVLKVIGIFLIKILVECKEDRRRKN